jgi:hypothetical protein
MRQHYTEIVRLEDLQKGDRPSSWNVFAQDSNVFATSDIHIAAFLQTIGIKCEGTMIHRYSGRDGRRVKIFMLFNYRHKTKEMRERIQDVLSTEWSGPEGQRIRLFMAEAESLRKKINETIDLDQE